MLSIIILYNNSIQSLKTQTYEKQKLAYYTVPFCTFNDPKNLQHQRQPMLTTKSQLSQKFQNVFFIGLQV